VTLYAYSCNSCSWTGPAEEEENTAWGDGVAHMNSTSHEGGNVQPFEG
jgi:hypothetical protein